MRRESRSSTSLRSLEMRRESRSATSLRSLLRSNGTNESQKKMKSLTGSGRFLSLPSSFRNRKGDVAREEATSSSITLEGKRPSFNSAFSTTKKKFSMRTSKSFTSLTSLETESSSSSSFTELVTPSALSMLEEHDSILDQIGLNIYVPNQLPSSCTSICEKTLHDSGEFPIFFGEDSDASLPTLSDNNTSHIRRFDRNVLHRVCKIGRGAYSDVYMALDQNRQKCALKALNPSRLETPEIFATAALDLAMEAKILSELDHENIIQLKGICSSTFSSSYSDGTDEGYFLVLELLSEVLSKRLNWWRKDKYQQCSSLPFEKPNKWTAPFGKSKSNNTSMMYERMQTVALGIVKGMIYLHEQGIVNRDLKPGNIGFDENGNVRLFDFGMARKLEDCDPDEICGSPRYMPPEVMAGRGYSLEADVYSFGIILYEICSLNVAFDNIRKYSCREEFKDLVIRQNTRPKLDRISCNATKQLIEDCWRDEPIQRPSFTEIYARIMSIVPCKNEETTPKSTE